MKKTLQTLGCLFAVVAAYFAMVSWFAHSDVVAAASQVRLYLTPTSASIYPSTLVSMQVRLAKNTTTKVDYVDAEVTFSPSILEAISVSKSGSYFTSGGGPSITTNNATGLISIKGSGAALPTTADVLVGTIVFRGDALGTAGIGFASSSQAGDMTGGGHVKNALDERGSATINVVSQPTSGGGGGTTGGGGSTTPPTPATTDPPATSDPTQSTTTPDATTEAAADATVPSSDTTTDQTMTPSAAAETKTTAVAAQPVWRQYLWALVGGGILLVGLVAVGVQYLRGRSAAPKDLGIAANPSDPFAAFNDGAAVASTEDFGPVSMEPEATSTDSELGGSFSDQPAEAVEQQVEPVASSFESAELSAPEPAAEPIDDTPPLPEPAVEELTTSKAPSDSVIEAAVTNEALESAAATPSEQAPVGVAAQTAPAQASPLDTALAAPVPVAVPTVEVPPQAVVPEPTQIASPPAPVAPSAIPVQSAPVTATPVAPPVAPVAIASPAAAAAPLTVRQTPATTIAPPAQTVDYTEMPDMFDLGEQRLRNEGFGDLKNTSYKPLA